MRVGIIFLILLKKCLDSMGYVFLYFVIFVSVLHERKELNHPLYLFSPSLSLFPPSAGCFCMRKRIK